MEKIGEFFKDIKERLSAPLLSSFITSWLIFNWKVIIGLFFYKNDQLKIDGYNSYFDLFNKSITLKTGFLYPLSAALIYTLVFPFIKNLLLAFNAWIKAWGNKLTLSISKPGVISVSKYIELKKRYTERTELLEKIIKDDSDLINKNGDLKTQLQIANNAKNELQQQISGIYARTNNELLSGTWEIHLETAQSGKQEIKKVAIDNNQFVFLDTEYTWMAKENTVKNFYFNEATKEVTFFVESTLRNTNSYRYFDLEVLDSGKLLKGKENRQNVIEMRKR